MEELCKLILIIALIGCITCKCPNPEALYPCKCDFNAISCGGNEAFNLKSIFKTIDHNLADDEKNFPHFYLSNTAITELEENTFYGITFEMIEISNATKLNFINTNAFNSTNLVTRTFTSRFTPLMNSPPNHDLFLSLSSMLNIEIIDIRESNITKIPSHAFRPVNGIQSKLWRIYIAESSSIKEIGNFPLYNMNNLKEFSIQTTQVEFIPTDAFHFDKESNETLSIYMGLNQKLSGDSFAINAFTQIKRPTNLIFFENSKLTFLDRNIFKPFFSLNVKNKLGLGGERVFIDCDDCRSYWLLREPQYLNSITCYTPYIICSNGNDFRDKSNFKNCK